VSKNADIKASRFSPNSLFVSYQFYPKLTSELSPKHSSSDPRDNMSIGKE